MPTATTDAQLSGQVVMDCAGQARSLAIPAGSTLMASRQVPSTLTLYGNLVVKGRLDYGTAQDRVTASAEIIFSGVDDGKFQGTPSLKKCSGNDCVRGKPEDTPMHVLASDIGLWVMESGVVTAAGQLKTSWTRLAQTALPTSRTVDLTAPIGEQAVIGWRAGDMLMFTPSATTQEKDFATRFDINAVESVAANRLTVLEAPKYTFAGCKDCIRRSEVANLSRNVVIRSKDDTGHAHIMVAQQGKLQFDSVEVRWMGPQKACAPGKPEKRAAIFFHEQREASKGSFVRHSSIWGGGTFFVASASHGIEVQDVVGYDSDTGHGFRRTYNQHACGTRCKRPYGPKTRDSGWEPRMNNTFDRVLAAYVAVPKREGKCLAIGSANGMTLGGGDTLDSVVTGVAYNYKSAASNISAIHFSEGGNVTDPEDQVLRIVAHNNGNHGVGNWQNGTKNTMPYSGIFSWSNYGHGLLAGAYGNGIMYQDAHLVDNMQKSFAVKGTMSVDKPRLKNAVLDQLGVVMYTFVPERAIPFVNLRFTGAQSPAITQIHSQCTTGNENDPNDGSTDCIRGWLWIENAVFPDNVIPFDFGWHPNKHTIWEVRGFKHARYPNLPANFDLHRRDNQIAGGHYEKDFDAWLVPR